MALAHRPSELTSIKCSSALMRISPDSIRLIPSGLSKTDRPGLLGPPIQIFRLKEDMDICPVVALEKLLSARSLLGVPHDYVFCGHSAPFLPMSTAKFCAHNLVSPTSRHRRASRFYALHGLFHRPYEGRRSTRHSPSGELG